MAALNRFLVYLALLILLGIGSRLMYYGLQTVVGAAPNNSWIDVLWLLVGIVLFVGGIVTGILFLSPPAHN